MPAALEGTIDSRIAANRRLWNEWARINQESDFYDMAGFRAGQTSLKPIELEEVGNVAGKSLLHLLQCPLLPRAPRP